MAKKEAAASFGALLAAASRYLNDGLPLSKLTPWETQRLNFLALPHSEGQLVSADPHWWRNLWLGVWDNSMIGVGINGDYENLWTLVDQYRPNTADILFPFPSKLADGHKHDSGLLLMIFTRQGLKLAAKTAEPEGRARPGERSLPSAFEPRR